MKGICVLSVILCFSATLFAQNIKLPAPDKKGGKPLMQVLNNRKSGRVFNEKQQPLSDKHLSNLLWAAFGVNREDGRRTAPSSRNVQDIDIYVVMAKGTYLYDAVKHELKEISVKDLREFTGMQDFVKTAAVNLVFVSDYSKFGNADDVSKAKVAAINTGFISENAYLYCASAGLVTVGRAMFDEKVLSEKLMLNINQHITFTQSVGYPK